LAHQVRQLTFPQLSGDVDRHFAITKRNPQDRPIPCEARERLRSLGVTGHEVQALSDPAAIASLDDPVGVMVSGRDESRPSRGTLCFENWT
jgi:hypothetical protein